MSKAVSPVAKAIGYAETQLNVQGVYTDAIAARNALDELLIHLSEARDEKRDKEAQLDDKQMDISAEERGKHSDMSEAGMTRHLKLAFSNDLEVREYRQHILTLSNAIDGMEYDKSIYDTNIKIAVARMIELGGYLNYLAAIRNAS